MVLGVWPAWLVADRYYVRRFGLVRPAPRRRTLSWRLVVAVGVLAFVVLSAAEVFVRPTVNLLAMGMALSLFAFWWAERPFKGYYLAVSALLLVVALLPLVGSLPGERSPEFNAVLANGATGSFMILRGVMDHRWLVRNLKPLPEEEGGGSAV